MNNEFPLSPEEILEDYRLAYRSRQASLIGRREVMSGKAKFGIFGDGKEVPQLAMAHAFRPGDFRSGYYRDQTFMLATGQTSLEQFFAQLYAHADVQAEPATAGRAMNAHFGTRLLHPDGSWKDLANIYNSSSDVSPTGSQMPRLVGLAYASRLYRELDQLKQFTQFSKDGNEIAFGTIGNATTAEGIFWEAINATGVLQSPMIISIWDDEYGISVHNRHQVVKENISELLKGFQREPGSRMGFDISIVRGWDYPTLVKTYLQVAETVRQEHIPAIIHVTELTQPQGHSTSGSHERYKTHERLAWEQEYDCLKQFRQWILSQDIIAEDELLQMEAEDRKAVEGSRKQAWESYLNPIRQEQAQVLALIDDIISISQAQAAVQEIRTKLAESPNPLRRDLMVAIREVLLATREQDFPARQALIQWKLDYQAANDQRYGSHLYSHSVESALQVPEAPAVYSEQSAEVLGFEVLNAFFDKAFAREPRLLVFGEDVGQLGDVNQGLRGLQDKYGPLRISDTGIREATIVGQAIGLALRGLRPIAEIQYLDYLLYALQILSDDLATLHWRTAGGQKAPVIVRTRGHRLEGIWHSGSLMAGILNLVRGMHLLVPRNMTQAAGFYNTLLRSDDPAVVVEVLNGYRLRETLPDNIGEYCLPLGVPEVLRPGDQVTLVTYGATCRIVMEASQLLSQASIEAEVIDIRSLLPFDIHHKILDSLKKTGRVVFIDEDVPGGATAYMLQEVLEVQGGYTWLDSAPLTIPGKAHRPAYGSDGDYWSKPNVEQIFETVYKIMHEDEPARYPLFF
jgi:2-oxoisovalerate dehydrogenase E1 component